MKQHLLPALRLTFISIIVFVGLYSLAVWGVAQAAPNKGLGETLVLNGKTTGYLLEGQKFDQDQWFNGRPSAVGYNAGGSGGSNKGPSNPDYLKDVQGRIDTFLAHNPQVKREAVPADLVTGSGSGLDPDISVPAAYAQVERIARVRNIPANAVEELVGRQVKQPLLGLFGTSRVNVLQLNIALLSLAKK